MPEAARILFGAIFTVAVCTALGGSLLRGLRLELHRLEEHLIAFYAGAAGLSLLIFLLGLLKLLYSWVLLALGFAALGLALRLRLHRPTTRALPPLPRYWRVLFGVLSGVYAGVYLLYAMAPEHSPDGSTYHLGLVAKYLRAHQIERIPTNIYAHLSQGIELLYLFAFAFGKHSAAAVVHWAFLISLALAMLCYGERFGQPVAGAVGALLFLISPVAGKDGTTAYIDVAVAALAFAVFYMLQLWDQTGPDRLLAIAGSLAGFAYAAKYTAGVAVFYGAAFVAWRLRRQGRRLLGCLAMFILGALLLAGPWMARNWIWYGNPFSPFFNSLFPNPYVHIISEQEYREYFRHYDLKSPAEIPREVTIAGFRLNGLLGPVFLLAPLGLLALRWPWGRRLWLAALAFGCTYPLNISTRFLLPVLPFLSLALAAVVVQARGMATLLVIAHALASWPSHLKLYAHPHAWRLEPRIPWRQALRIEPEEVWLSRIMPSYQVARMLEERVPPGERVFTYAQVAEAYTTREVLVFYAGAFNDTLFDALRVPISEDWAPARHVHFRFEPRPLSRIRIRVLNEEHNDQWSVNEIRFLSGGKSLQRKPGWQFTARPNRWEIELALDGNLASRWRSWEKIRAGMFIEARFNPPEVLEEVLLVCPLAPWDLKLVLEAEDRNGQWHVAGHPPEHEIVEQLPVNLRREAARSLKQRGVNWLLIHESDFWAEDFKQKAGEWGLELVDERAGARLYRIR